jgi:hypothetical protein
MSTDNIHILLFLYRGMWNSASTAYYWIKQHSIWMDIVPKISNRNYSSDYKEVIENVRNM